MSVEQITKKIKADADEKASDIRAEAEKKKEKIEQETTSKKESLEKEATLALGKEKAHERSVFLSAAKQANNIARQEVKHELVKGMLSEVYDSLLNIPDEEYVSFFSKCVQAENIPTTSIVSVTAPEDRKQATETILKENGITASVTYNNDLQSGLILYGEDIVVDLSLSRLFAESSDDLLQKVTADLFN